MNLDGVNSWIDLAQRATPGESHVSGRADALGELIWRSIQLANWGHGAQRVQLDEAIHILDVIRNAVAEDIDSEREEI